MPDVWSSGASTADVATSYGVWWLKVPETPALNMTVRWQPGSIRIRRVEPQGRFRTFGRAAPVVTRGTLGTDEMQISILLYDTTEIDAFVAIREAQQTVLLQDPRGRQWYLALGETVESEEPFDGDRRSTPIWRVTVPAVEVEAP